jgi:hypothetical protein
VSCDSSSPSRSSSMPGPLPDEEASGIAGFPADLSQIPETSADISRKFAGHLPKQFTSPSSFSHHRVCLSAHSAAVLAARQDAPSTSRRGLHAAPSARRKSLEKRREANRALPHLDIPSRREHGLQGRLPAVGGAVAGWRLRIAVRWLHSERRHENRTVKSSIS